MPSASWGCYDNSSLLKLKLALHKRVPGSGLKGAHVHTLNAEGSDILPESFTVCPMWPYGTHPYAPGSIGIRR